MPPPPPPLSEPCVRASASATQRTAGILQPEPAAAASANSYPFTQDQIAIALAFAKSNPANRTIDEYIEDIQSCIKQDRKVPSASRRLVFDDFQYWRDQCDKLLREKKALEEKVVSLEKHHQHCRRALDANHDSSQESEGAPENNEREVRISRKRTFTADDDEEHSFTRMNEVVFLSPPADNLIDRVGGHIHKLRNNLERLDKLGKSAVKIPEIEMLANFAPSVISNLHNTLSDCFLTIPYLKVNDGNKRMLDMLGHISNLMIQSFMSAFSALNEISKTIEGRRRKGKLIYDMAKFFHNSLDLLHTLSSIQLEHEEVIANHNLRRKKVRMDETEYVANKQLGRILSTIVYNLGWKQIQSVHSEVLEGIVYAVLDHIGRILSTATFGEHIAASSNPGKITENGENAVTDKLSKHEMRYAIQVLHNTLGGRDKKDLFLHVLAAGKKMLANQQRISGSSIVSVPPGDLLQKAKVLLQSTLVKSTLGYDELETLISPSSPEEVPGSVVAGIEDALHGPMWFAEQVWSLIGWDLVLQRVDVAHN